MNSPKEPEPRRVRSVSGVRLTARILRIAAIVSEQFVVLQEEFIGG